VFARLRASPAGEAATRTQEFFRQLNFEEGFRIAMNGPLGAASGATLPGDEATLAALHEAWERHPWKQGSNPGAQAQERLAELAEHLPPRDRAAEAEPLRYLDISACLGTGADETVAAIASDLGVPPGRTAAADLYASHIAAAADSCEASPKAAPEASDDASERVRVAGGDLPFRDGEFGVVTMLMAAHHFADAPHVFAEVHRVTQPGARLILREHGRADAVAALYYDVLDGFAEVTTGKRSPREWVARYERDRTRYRTPTEWAALAAEAGFTLDAERALRADPFDAVLLAFIRK
jgi:SAM-dependent methyltransferase